MRYLYICISLIFLLTGPVYGEVGASQKMHVITVASTIDKRLVKLFDTCIWQGIDIQILGVGKPYQGNGQKLDYIKEYAQKLDPNDIILFVDAFDVLFIANEERILEKFLALNTPFLISGEKNCFPFPYLKSQYPQTTSPFKYINSGTFIGYAGFIFNMLQDIAIDPKVSDQGQLSKYLLNRLSSFSIDYFAEIFLCLSGVSEEEIIFDLKEKVLYCVATQSFPCVIHANGRSFGKVYQQAYQLFSQDND